MAIRSQNMRLKLRSSIKFVLVHHLAPFEPNLHFQIEFTLIKLGSLLETVPESALVQTCELRWGSSS